MGLYPLPLLLRALSPSSIAAHKVMVCTLLKIPTGVDTFYGQRRLQSELLIQFILLLYQRLSRRGMPSFQHPHSHTTSYKNHAYRIATVIIYSYMLHARQRTYMYMSYSSRCHLRAPRPIKRDVNGCSHLPGQLSTFDVHIS